MGRIRAILAVVAVLLAAGCSAEDGETASSAVEAQDAAVEAETQAEADEAGEAAAQPVPPEGGVGEEVPPLPDASGVDRVIKEGTMRLEVGAGGFDASYARVVEAARRLGGSVAASTTRTQEDDGGTSGSVTIRVPVDQYEDLLVQVADIGTVRSRDVTASDVSTEYVDLQARRRNLEAQERFYLGLLERAEGVPDAIAIQQQLTTITEQLEQVKGRIAFLDDRTAFSTLTVELFEPGVVVPLAEDGTTRPSLARFWQLAQDAFVNVIGATLVAAAFLAPIALLGLAAFVVWRITPRRAPTPPARSEPEREHEPAA